MRPLPSLLDALLSPSTYIHNSTDNGTCKQTTPQVTKSNTSNNNDNQPRDPRQRPTPLIVEDDEEDGAEEGEVAPVEPVKKRLEGRVPCKYWMEGKCSKGDQCTFNHQLTPNRTAADVRLDHHRLLSLPTPALLSLADASPTQTLWEVLTTGVCRFRMGRTGICSKGDSCLYSHDLASIPCRFWHAWGRCAAGRECRFSHEPVEEALRERIRREAVEAVQKERALGKRKRTADDVGEHGVPEETDCDAKDDGAFSEELARQINPFA